MGTIERWLPFKFRRKNAEEKHAESTPARAQQPMPWESFFGPPLSQFMRNALEEPYFKDPFARMAEVDRWFGDYSPRRFQPTVDVVDEETSLRVTAELPGMSQDDVQLSIDNDTLTIRGEKKNAEEGKENGAFRTERYYGFVQRSVPLPTNIDRDKAEASFDKGVLTIRLPKTGDVVDKSTDIPIKSAS